MIQRLRPDTVPGVLEGMPEQNQLQVYHGRGQARGDVGHFLQHHHGGQGRILQSGAAVALLEGQAQQAGLAHLPDQFPREGLETFRRVVEFVRHWPDFPLDEVAHQFPDGQGFVGKPEIILKRVGNARGYQLGPGRVI